MFVCEKVTKYSQNTHRTSPTIHQVLGSQNSGKIDFYIWIVKREGVILAIYEFFKGKRYKYISNSFKRAICLKYASFLRM